MSSVETVQLALLLARLPAVTGRRQRRRNGGVVTAKCAVTRAEPRDTSSQPAAATARHVLADTSNWFPFPRASLIIRDESGPLTRIQREFECSIGL